MLAYVPSLSLLFDTAAPHPSRVLHFTQNVRNIVSGVTQQESDLLSFSFDQIIGIYS